MCAANANSFTVALLHVDFRRSPQISLYFSRSLILTANVPDLSTL